MLQLNHLLPPSPTVPTLGVLRLPFDARQKSRQRVQLADGREVAVILPRGTVMRDGDLLQADSGERVRVEAADETVSEVRSANPTQLTRLAYHLGNRHVALQVSEGFLRYQHDHVLDAMVRGLGGEVIVHQAAFEPEAGAYGHHHHGHSHSHSHSHE